MGTQMSLFDRLGGVPAITAAAELSTARFWPTHFWPPYFDDVDMDRQLAKQAAFLAMALGGPDRYAGRDLRTAHARQGALTDEHVDR
jgi:hemoglobin